MAADTAATLFPPARLDSPALGLVGTGALVLVVAVVPAVLLRAEIPVAALVVNGVVTGGLALYLAAAFLAWCAMAYAVADEALELRMSPLPAYRIRWRDLVSIERVADLGDPMLASQSWKGLVLRGVRYRGWGVVRMCATRSTDVLVLTTASGRRYGVTPADEDAFLAAVAARSG